MATDPQLTLFDLAPDELPQTRRPSPPNDIPPVKVGSDCEALGRVTYWLELRFPLVTGVPERGEVEFHEHAEGMDLAGRLAELLPKTARRQVLKAMEKARARAHEHSGHVQQRDQRMGNAAASL